jgi:mono/diheme cytochrome c family protein
MDHFLAAAARKAGREIPSVPAGLLDLLAKYEFPGNIREFDHLVRDALAGFILSPAGSRVFTSQCSACHTSPGQLAADPQQLTDALTLGPDFAPHSAVDIPDWTTAISAQERTALLNFLAAPDGQRLFAVYCGAGHGRSVDFQGDRATLRDLISRGGLHLEMPPWRERLTEAQILTLAAYVVDRRPLLREPTCSASTACSATVPASRPPAGRLRRSTSSPAAGRTRPCRSGVTS